MWKNLSLQLIQEVSHLASIELNRRIALIIQTMRIYCAAFKQDVDIKRMLLILRKDNLLIEAKLLATVHTHTIEYTIKNCVLSIFTLFELILRHKYRSKKMFTKLCSNIFNPYQRLTTVAINTLKDHLTIATVADLTTVAELLFLCDSKVKI